MNHLRDLLDSPGLRAAVLNSHGERAQLMGEIRPALVESVFAEVKSYGEQATCFWLGDLDQVCELTIIPELCRLPFKTCWFEAEMKCPIGFDRPLSGLLVTEAENGEVDAISVTRIGRNWHLDGTAHGESMGAEFMEMWSVDDVSGIQLRHALFAAKAFLSALHCSNVKRQEHTIDAKLQKARASRGKAPLYSYWTLQLDGKSERGSDAGGTHASPRVHLRRGHPRQYSPGKWTWVQAHAVGNRAAGIVHKDYSAGPGLTANRLTLA